ncbi:MAG: hypothetical protein MK105_13075 [Crocinitomicaceae bacterium]|nr:hypothetical protein [Crocinitomicaceae bacterium]
MKSIGVFIVLILSGILTSCSIETAKPSSKKKLVIASDYLTSKDTVLFTKFIKQSGVQLSIFNMSTDRIIGTIRNTEANSGIDVLMVKSLYDVSRLNKRDILQNLNFSETLPMEAQTYASWKYNYVGIGIDPYIIAFDLRKNNNSRMYNDLTLNRYLNGIENDHFPPLLAPVLKKLNKAKGNKWIKRYLENGIQLPTKMDSLQNDTTYIKLPLICTMSFFKEQKDSLPILKNRSYLLPNERTTGIFYNVRSISLVDQAENFTTAKEFLFHYLEEENNIALNKKINTYSIYSNHSNFRKYNTSPEMLIPYYSMIDRIKRKLEKD